MGARLCASTPATCQLENPVHANLIACLTAITLRIFSPAAIRRVSLPEVLLSEPELSDGIPVRFFSSNPEQQFEVLAMLTSQPPSLGRTSSDRLTFGCLSSPHPNTLLIKPTISRDQSIHNRELQAVLWAQLRN
jgi:hypothetical protein